MYTITLGQTKNVKADVRLDHKNPALIPPFVFLGVGDKKKRYTEFLESAFTTRPNVLHYLAFLHKNGKENGSLNLTCKCQMKRFHAPAIKEFLETHRDTLDALLPYLFADSGYTAGEAIERLKGPGSDDATATAIQALGEPPKLPQRDLDIITGLIELDQAKEASETQTLAQ